jgi:hypothetical protein
MLDSRPDLPKTVREGKGRSDRPGSAGPETAKKGDPPEARTAKSRVPSGDPFDSAGDHQLGSSGITGSFFARGEAESDPGDDGPVSEHLPPMVQRTPEQEARRAQLMRVVGGLVVVTGIVGVIALMRGRPRARDLPIEPANTAAQTATAPPVVPTVTATAEPVPEPPVATATPSATASATAAPTATAVATPEPTAKPTAKPIAEPGPTPPPTPTPPSTPDDESGPLTVRISKALEQGKAGKAVTLAQQLTAQQPGSASAWYLRGAAEQAAGRGGKASFRKCAELAAPDSSVATECRALAGM